MKNLEDHKSKKSGILMLSGSYTNQFRYNLPDPDSYQYSVFQKFLRLRKRTIRENNKVALNLILDLSRKHESSDWKKQAISKIIEDIYISKECSLDPAKLTNPSKP